MKKVLLLMSINSSIIWAMDTNNNNKPVLAAKTVATVAVVSTAPSSQPPTSEPTKSIMLSHPFVEEAKEVSSSLIAQNAIPVNVFPCKSFNTDEYYDSKEWALIDSQDAKFLTQILKFKILARKPSLGHYRDFNNCYDPKKAVSIPESDDSLPEKKVEDKTCRIEYECTKKAGPWVYVRQYAQDHPRGAAIGEIPLEVKNDRLVVATAINSSGTYAMYADDADQLCICNVGQQKWGMPISLPHMHDAFESKYTSEINKEEKAVSTIKSLTFIAEHVVAVRNTKNCISFIHISPECMFNHLKCFEAPEEGTGLWTGSAILGKRKYNYKFGIEKRNDKGEPVAIDVGLVRTYGNDTFDRFDRFPLNLALNHVTPEQVLFLGFMGCIGKIKKEHVVDNTQILHRVQGAYRSPVLMTFPFSAQQAFKKTIEEKAKEIGLVLK